MYQVRDMHGSTVVVTGSNSGTGKETAKRLAGAGAHVIMAVRTEAKGEQAAQEIRAAHPDASVEVRRLDLASLASVHEFAATVNSLDVLVNNAGVMVPPKYELTVDGFELQFGTNFLGPFALTNLLLPVLLKSAAPRVATMSSSASAFGRIHFEDLQWTAKYRPWPAYGQSKLADLLMGQRLAVIAADRGWNLTSTIAHPGYTRTNLQQTMYPQGARGDFLRRLDARMPSMKAEQGAEPLLFAAADPAAVNGRYYGPNGRFGLTGEVSEATPPRTAGGPDLARSLWAVAEDLTGVRLPQ